MFIKEMEWSMMKKLSFLGLLLILILAGCQKSGKTEEEFQVPVETVKVDFGNVEQSLFFNGDIEAEIEVKVFAKIPDRIEAFHVDEGGFVRKGDPVADILATTIEQAVRQAEAYKNNMESEYVRAQRLNQQGAMSQQQFDAIETQVTQARAAFTSAQSQFGDATVLAPISGIIGKRYYETGDMANPAVPLVSIVQMDRVKLILQAAEQDLGRLAVGQDAEIRVKSYSSEAFRGRVSKISPVLDPMTRMAQVEVLTANPGHKLKPGMFAEVEVKTGTLKQVLTVPRYAAIENTSMETVDGREQVVKKYFVFVVGDSNKVEQRSINVIYINQINIAVESGLERGETIVVSGQNNLRDGMSVTAVQ
jgi:RND family efflux transporter MFP subunit